MSRICSVIFTLALLVAQTDVAKMQSPSEPDAVTVRFDYTGAEALLDAVERDSLTGADVMTLLEVRGIRAMVDNVTRYAATYGRVQFQAELRASVQTHQSTRSPFGLGQVFRNRAQVRSLIAELQGKEAAIIKGMLNERLVAITFWEGTANYAADALSAEGNGPYLEMWRSRYRRNAEPARIKENFGLFDTLLTDLRAGRIAWDEAQRIGFFGNNDARLYFVGYEMAKAIDRYRSAKRIGELLEQTPSAFFQEYITLYRQQSGVVARFTPETEAAPRNASLTAHLY